MSGEATSRVHYFDRQFLRVDEFRDEQLYQLALRRLHNITLHSWGIVSGLEVATEDDGATVVRPGVAIDGYGRELLLEEKFSIAADSFDRLATDSLDLWLVYERQDDGSAPAGYGECDTAAGASYRSIEQPQVLVEHALNGVDPRRPPGVPAEVLDSPIPLTSDDRNDLWRVYLGRLMRNDKKKITPDASLRPYAGIVAEVVKHPAHASRVEIGTQSAAAQTRRFAAFVPDESSPAPSADARLEVRSDGQILLRGSTEIDGSLHVSGGAIRFDDAVEPQIVAEPSICRVTESGKEELRIDLGSDVTRAFVIGFSTAEGKFIPCLRVEMQNENNTLAPLVTAMGDMQITGKLTAGQIENQALSVEAAAAILANFTMGIAAGRSGT